MKHALASVFLGKQGSGEVQGSQVTSKFHIQRHKRRYRPKCLLHDLIVNYIIYINQFVASVVKKGM